MKGFGLNKCVALGVSLCSLLITSMLLSGCGGGGRPSGGTPTGGIPTGSITGRLVTGGGKSRVAMAVAIMGVQTITPQVAFVGDRFRIDNVPAGEQVVCIRKQDGMEGAVVVALVLPGKVTDVGDVEIEPLGKVFGFVYEVDEAGNRVKPIAGAKVIARAIKSEDDQLGEISRGVFAVTKTDEDGKYELYLPEGGYLIEAHACGYQPAMDTVIVEPLAETQCDLGLKRIDEKGSGVVYGKVVANVEGQLVPVAGAIVVLAPKGEPPEPVFVIQPAQIEAKALLSAFHNPLGKKQRKQVVVPPAYGRIRIAFTDAEGNYRIEDVKPGGYRAVAFKEGYGSSEKDVKVSPGESVRVDFELKAEFCIVQGYVKDAETKQPIKDATVTATAFGDPWFIWDNWIELPGKPHADGKPVAYLHHGKPKRNEVGILPIKPVRPPILPPIRPPVRASAVTDEKGFYKLVLPEGEYLVAAWKDGYASAGVIMRVGAGKTVPQDFELTKLEPVLSLLLDLEMPDQVAVGEPVKLKLTLRNDGDEPVRLRFNTGQRYDFIVRNMEGGIVWQWSHDKAFTQVLGEVEIRPGEELSFNEVWRQVDNDGNQVGEGEYEVEGIITSDPPMAVARYLVIGAGGGEIALQGKDKRR